MTSFERRSLLRVGAALAMYALIGCAGDRSAPNGFAVRDSGGVTIAENSAVDPGRLPRWRIDTSPMLTIGVTEGDTTHQFGAIRGVSMLPNGTIVVLNGRGELAFEFRFFDSTGRHLATHGRLGQGPGEFRWVNFFGGVGGDTLIAVDFPNRRIAWVSAASGYLRSARLDENEFRTLLGDDASGMVETMVPFGDSVYAVKAYREIPGAGSLAQRAETFHIVDMRSARRLDAARFEDPPQRELRLSSGRTFISPAGTGTAFHVVDRERRRVCAAINSRTEILCIDAAGNRRTIRWTVTPVPYTDADRDSLEQRLRGNAAAMRRTDEDVNALLAAMERPEHHLPFSALALDRAGNFWIREIEENGAGKRSARFRVLDPDGRLIAFADGFPFPLYRGSIVHIGPDRVLRAIENADGAEVVGVYLIRK